MLDNHSMASEIIARAKDPQPVLDDNNLAILRRFCMDPSSKDDILKDLDLVDQPEDNEGKAGAKAQSKGGLAGFIVAKSAAGEDLLGKDEMGVAEVVSGRVGLRFEETWIIDTLSKGGWIENGLI